MKTRCIFSFCLNSKETHSRWKMISLSPSSESGPGLSWTSEVFQVFAIKFLGTANNLRQKGKKKKQPHLIGVLKYYLSPFGKAMSPIPAVNSDA